MDLSGLADEPAGLLGLAAVGALAVWALLVVVLAVLTRPRQPEPVGAGLEPGGEEPPAVVGMITSGWELASSAAAATLVDLAARGVVTFERVGNDRYTVRPGPEALDSGAPPYERKVFEVVADLGHGGVVPCEALTTGDAGEARKWDRSFRAAVVADARRRGLSRPRFTRSMWVVVAVAAIVPSALAAAGIVALSDDTSSTGDDNPIGGFIGIALIGWVALLAVFAALQGDRDTPAGLERAGRWLGLRENMEASGGFADLPPTAVTVWDRLLAHAVALGAARATARHLPLGAESDRRAWSSVGGRWRLVAISYPDALPPGWGRPPSQVALSGFLQLAVAGGIAWGVVTSADTDFGDVVAEVVDLPQAASAMVGLVAAIAAVIAGLWLARAATMLVLGIADTGRRRVVEGRLLRKRVRGSNDSGFRTYVAIDDGKRDRIRCRRRLGHLSPAQGDWVRAEVSPVLGYIRSLTTIPEPTPGTP